MGQGDEKEMGTEPQGERLPEPADELISESAFSEIYEEGRSDLPPAGRIDPRHPDEVPTAVIRELAPMDGKEPRPAAAPARTAKPAEGPWDGGERRLAVDRRNKDRRRRLGGWPPLPKKKTAAEKVPDPEAAEEVSLEESVASWARPADRPAPQVTTLARMRKRIERAADVQELGKALLVESLNRGQRVVLLRRSRQAWVGWTGAGEGVDPARISELVVPPVEGSIFGLVTDCGGHFQGALADHPAHRRFLQTVGFEAPETAALIPIQHGERAAMAIYLDGGPGGRVDADLGELLVLAQQVPGVLNRLARKATGSPRNTSD